MRRSDQKLAFRSIETSIVRRLLRGAWLGTIEGAAAEALEGEVRGGMRRRARMRTRKAEEE